MSIRLEMLQVARLAPKLLGESAELVRSFLSSRQNPDGGFGDRLGRSDLYYTVFGLEGLRALQAPLPEKTVRGYLDSFGDGETLDFVHLCCLARCWANLDPGSGKWPENRARRWLERLETFRTADGGFHPQVGAGGSSVYACFLATGAWQDLGLGALESARLMEVLNGLRAKGGGWPNERQVPVAATNSTAAAVTLLRQFHASIPPETGDWLAGCAHSQGGFVAAPGAPIPDLLSTATALHALRGMQREQTLEAVREPCLDFVDSLWTNEGGFHGHWDDHELDCEYTYYGLLALGHLSL